MASGGAGMRFFLALTVTVLGDALAWIAGLAAFGLAVWQMIVHGVPISVAVLGAAALVIGAAWFMDHRFKPARRWRDAVFRRASYGPAPSRPGLDAPGSRALAYAIGVAPMVTFILLAPLVVLLAPVIGETFAGAASMIIMIELLIGGPTLFGVGYAAYDRACAEFGAERFPPKGDSGLDKKIRRRMVGDKKGE